MCLVFVFQNVFMPLSHLNVTKQFIVQIWRTYVYTVEDCIAYKAAANCGVLETKQNEKRYGKVYKGCLLSSFKIHKLNYNAYNQGKWNCVSEHTLLKTNSCFSTALSFALLLQS